MQRSFAPAPRHVPLSLRIANLFGVFGLVGWGVLGFGSIFAWTFGYNADLSVVTFRGELARAMGQVIKVEETGASEGDVRVMASHYEYSVAGRPFQGVAYLTGEAPQVGQSVTVEYKPANPAASRVPGMRRAMFGPLVLLVLIFPLIGALFALGSFMAGRKRNHLLREGIVTYGTLKEKRETNMRVNDRLVWELVFEFTARDGTRHEAKATTTSPERLEDERQEPLLYDPADPSRAFLLDDAPARPQLDERGELVGRSSAFGRLVLPAIVVAANVFVAMRMLG